MPALIPTQSEDQRNQAFSDAGYAAPTPTSTVPAPINRTVTEPAADPATTFLNTFTPPETADQIAERKRKASAGLIDSINGNYDTKVADSNKAGVERVAMDNAVSVLSGLTGSTEAVRTRTAVNDANSKEVAAINNERLLKLNELNTDISSQAETEARQQLQDATKSAQDIVARRAAAQSKALDTIKTMAAGGLVDFNSFKNSPKNKQVYDYAVQAAGSDDALSAIFAMNRPKDQIVGTPTRVGDHFVQAYQNPITGTVSYDTISLPGGIPANYTSFQKIGDSKTGEFLYAIPDNWDGDQSKLKLIASTKGVGDGTSTGAGGYNGQFAQTIDAAAALSGSVYAQKAAKENLQSAIAAGDYRSAYVHVTQAVANGLQGANRTKFEDATIDQSLMKELRDRIQSYADAHGDMNIFKGTADDIGKRIGVLANDPKYAALATELDRSFQQYRQNMTGAAFGANESADYAKVVPTKGKSIDLNLATLNGALNYADDFVKSTIKSKIGDGGVYIKEYAEGAQPNAGGAGAGGDLKSQVTAKGYDYDKLKADGHSDAEIQAAIAQ